MQFKIVTLKNNDNDNTFIILIVFARSLAGEDLIERIVSSEYVLTEEDVISYIRQVAQGLNHMHMHNIVHLDIKVLKHRKLRN
jgi:serine/threonine protein kinase